jgi:hypothetical protein
MVRLLGNLSFHWVIPCNTVIILTIKETLKEAAPRAL